MRVLRFALSLMILAVCTLSGSARDGRIVIADSVTHAPLANAAIFSHKGAFIASSRNNGTLPAPREIDYPLSVRLLGYSEKTVIEVETDTVFLREQATSLPEVTVEARQQKILHVLAYVREYSSLSSYTDTIAMFREKMVDFMLVDDPKIRFKGWDSPRVLNARSYYRFTDANGLDSVSDRCDNHFTWSDWLGLLPERPVPARIARTEAASDTVFGRYGPLEIWQRNGDRVSVNVDVMADTASRRWVPALASFFRKDNTDFERFTLRLNYGNVVGDRVGPLDLAGYSFNIESRGRGRNMFKFNKYDQPFFVTTYTEVYILDKEFIPVKEARKWDSRDFDASAIVIIEPEEAPDLQPSTLALIERVNGIDSDYVRLSLKPDQRLVGLTGDNKNFRLGNRVLNILKSFVGISERRGRKNNEQNWQDFLNKQKSLNHRHYSP